MERVVVRMRERTVAVPLGDKLVFEKGSEVPGEERVHVDPDAAKVPEQEEAEEVAVEPGFLVLEFEQLAGMELGAPC